MDGWMEGWMDGWMDGCGQGDFAQDTDQRKALEDTIMNTLVS